MAKKHSTGRKAKRVQKKPRYVEIAGRQYETHPQGVLVEGHYLNPRQVEQFRGKVEERLGITENWSNIERLRTPPKPWAHKAGFDDFLWLYRPRAKAKTVINELAMEITNTAIAIASTRDFSFHDSDACAEGVILLGKLLEQAERKVDHLRHFVESVAREPQEHLQDWTRREAERAARFGARP